MRSEEAPVKPVVGLTASLVVAFCAEGTATLQPQTPLGN